MKPTLKPGMTHRFSYKVPENKTVPHTFPESPEIAAMEATGVARKRSPAEIQADVFGNVEMQFKKTGDPSAPLKTLRHFGANLDDAIRDAQFMHDTAPPMPETS